MICATCHFYSWLIVEIGYNSTFEHTISNISPNFQNKNFEVLGSPDYREELVSSRARLFVSTGYITKQELETAIFLEHCLFVAILDETLTIYIADQSHCFIQNKRGMQMLNNFLKLCLTQAKLKL